MRRLLILLVVPLWLAASAPPAAATLIPCLFDEETGEIDATTEAGYVLIHLENANEIYANSQPCGGATTSTAEAITITAGLGDVVEITLADGPYAPGATDEGDGSSEIEFHIAGGPVFLTIEGSGTANHLTASSAAGSAADINLNAAEADDDADLTIEYNALAFLEVTLGAGPDRFEAGPSHDRDLTTAFFGEVAVEGGAGADVLEPGWGDGTYWGDTESDIIDDKKDTFTIAWLPSDCEGVVLDNDVAGGDGDLPCGEGTDLVTGGFELLVGHPGPSFIFGSGFGEEIKGGAGDDRIAPYLGMDTVVGGPGWDSLIVGATSPVHADLTNREVLGEGREAYTGIEGIFSGAAGMDIFEGAPGAGIETVYGGGGNNVLDLRPAGHGYIVYTTTTAMEGQVTQALFATGFTVLGTRLADTMIGGPSGLANGHDEFRGLGGDDQLEGGPGPDSLLGGEGDDTIRGGAGTDTCLGGPGFDIVSGCEL